LLNQYLESYCKRFHIKITVKAKVVRTWPCYYF